MRNKIHISNLILLFALVIASLLMTSCQKEGDPLSDTRERTGRIVLSTPQVELFTQLTTRAEATGNIGDYTYTLSGTDVDNNAVTDQEITFTNGSAIIPAGTYTLTATSKTAQDAAPWYQGTSASFSLTPGGTQAVAINLGKPKNIKIDVTFDESFTKLYENYSLTIGAKSVTAAGTLYAAVPSDGSLSYTIHAKAKQDTHISDIPAAGITGTLTVTAGNSYPLNITAKSISDIMIEFDSGTHTGTFDSKHR